jgi:site-specific recombinase XerD
MSEIRKVKQEHLEIKDLSVSVLEEFLEWLEQERECSISTRNQRLAAIHSLFRYIGSQQPEYLYQMQQILSIPAKKTSQKAVKYLDVHQVRNLLASPDVSKRKGRRDQALLCLLYDSGCRVQELADIEVKDIRFTTPPQVSLMGKGRKIRTVPLMRKTADILENYIMENRLNATGKTDTPLFYNIRGEKLTRQGITYILKKYSVKIDLPDITSHTMRHSKAMHLTDADVNPVYIRDFMGHTDLKVTQIYSKASVEMKRKIFEKLGAEKSPLPVNDNASKDWSEDKDLLNWLHSLGH